MFQVLALCQSNFSDKVLTLNLVVDTKLLLLKWWKTFLPSLSELFNGVIEPIEPVLFILHLCCPTSHMWEANASTRKWNFFNPLCLLSTSNQGSFYFT